MFLPTPSLFGIQLWESWTLFNTLGPCCRIWVDLCVCGDLQSFPGSMGTALSQKWLFILRCVFSEVRGRSVIRRRHVGLEMSHAVWAAVGLLGNLEINAAGIIFDSTLGKPSVCTKNKTKKQTQTCGGGSKAGCTQRPSFCLLKLPVNKGSALRPAEVQLALWEELTLPTWVNRSNCWA